MVTTLKTGWTGLSVRITGQEHLTRCVVSHLLGCLMENYKLTPLLTLNLGTKYKNTSFNFLLKSKLDSKDQLVKKSHHSDGAPVAIDTYI